MTATTTRPQTTTRRPGFRIAVAASFVLIVGLLVFVLQNTIHTRINFIAWNFDLAQGVSLLGAAVVGAVITLVVSAAIRLRKVMR